MSNEAHDDQMKRSEGLQRDGNGVGNDTIENEKTEKPAIKYENDQRPGLSSSNGSKTATEKKEEEKPKPSKLKTYWGKLGLDIGTLLMMFKGSLPPVIGIALYQADSFAKLFSTLGYLVPIITVLCIVIMPRAKYFQTIILNTIGICVGSAIALLGIWSGVQARKHTTPAGSTAIYNSSQSAVCAIWLFANIYVVNTLRAKLPALQFPVIMYSIFTNVAFTYGPLFSTIAAGETLVRELLLGFLTAYGIATAVHLFIMPMSSRTVVFKEQAGYIGLVRGTIKATTAYIQSLESTDMFADEKDNSTNEDSDGKSQSKPKDKQGGHPSQTPQALALKGSIAALTGLHGKLYGDIPFAKREMTWGKLDAKDLDEIFTLFRAILIPLCGMGTITDIFERIAERRGWIKSATKSQFDKLEAWEHCPDEEKAREKQLWNDIVKTLHEPFLIVTQAMDEGMEHAGIALEILPKPKKKKGEDVEAAEGTEIKPGDPEFSKYLDQKMKNFYGQRGETLKTWAREKGLSEEAFDSANNLPVDAENITADAAQHRRDQQQLYLILYMEYLLFSTGVAILDLVRFADTKVASGSMKKNHFIFPGKRRLKKWLLSIGSEDSAADHESPDSMEAGSHNIYMGAGFNPKKDPEHLPPATAWQRFGNVVRTIPRLLGSAESAFGFRVACATMSIGIVAYLEASYRFFMEQRLVWAMFMIAIGMTMTSGQSIFGFFGRIAGTFLAAVFSIVIYYIVDGKTAGVIVMLWLFIFIEMYFFLKFPRFITITLICVVTQVLIIGYELQVRKIGIAASTASGQPYYPTYKLAPYRLACVAGGSFVAFIWTIFPYPLTDRSWLRKDLGQTLYLLANYYSVVHATIGARMHNTEGDMDLKSSPGRRLQKVRHYIFGKLLLLLPSLQQHADWQKWEPTIGGKFPRESYDGITLRAKNIMNYLSLISYATMTWSRTNASGKEMEEENASQAEWLRDLSRLIDSIGPTSHHVTSTLSLLSASVTTGTALPPYISIPKPYQLSERLEQLDSGILGSRHVQEPGYSAYAVMQVASSLITDDLERLVNHVKDLVGETDFSFKVMMSDISMSSSEDGKGKRD